MAEHQRHIRELLAPLETRAVENLPMPRALGRALARDVHAPIDLPVFRNSAMDGYAVRASSLITVPVTLPVHGTIAAGEPGDEPLADGAAMKIMTGAPLPTGADCVVPVEHTDGGESTVTVRTPRVSGDFVREPGTDVRNGMLLMKAGTVLAPRHIAVLAAVGAVTVPVRRPISAVTITTGNELVAAGSRLGPGQIYDSNGIALAAALEANGVQVIGVAHSTDDRDEFRRILDAAINSADVVFTSGGVSMGDYEVVKETLEPLGGEFGVVAVQPGGPQGTTVLDGVAVLSFPGNPVSAMVSFEIFARPVLRDLAGLRTVAVETLPVTTDLVSPAGRRQFRRGRRTDDAVEVVSGPQSHLIAGMALADVLIDIPEEVTSVPAGSPVGVLAL